MAVPSLQFSSCRRTRDHAKRARSRPSMFLDTKFLLAASSSFSSTSHQVRHEVHEPTSTKGRPSSHCGRHPLRKLHPVIALPCTSSEVHSGQIPHCKHVYTLTLEGSPGSRVLNPYPNMSWFRLVTGGQVNVGSGSARPDCSALAAMQHSVDTQEQMAYGALRQSDSSESFVDWRSPECPSSAVLSAVVRRKPTFFSLCTT